MTTLRIHQLLQAMWQDYLQLNPQARQIHQLFAAENPQLQNDHIALRTFDLPEVDLQHLAKPFIAAGYSAAGEYQFPVKHLDARHYQHPDPALPKLFISQLHTHALSEINQRLLKRCVATIPPALLQRDDFCYSGRHWPLSYAEYQQLLEESEYAAWVAAFGFRPNHFTIFINSLDTLHSVAEVNALLKHKGFQLNSAGGEIKGGPQAYLEQSSTLANKVTVQFSDQAVAIPGCYYEFARRYPLADGTLYQGFVAASADKIFESTDSR